MSDSTLHLLRFSGEIGVKSRGTRTRFVRRLEHNLSAGLDAAGITHRIENQWGRLLLEADGPGAADLVARTFGIHSLSRIVRLEWASLDRLVESSADAARPAVAGRTFAVRARRGRGRQEMGFESPEVERLVGERLVAGSAGVDLERPEVEVEIEIHRGEAHLAVGRTPGPGGFPVGVQGRALALVSGGFDSAVAAWKVLRRGVGLDYLFFNLAGAAHRDAVSRVLAVLGRDWSHGDHPRVHVVDLREVADQLRARVPGPLVQVALKRVMIRAASRRAEGRAQALVTGEAIGQVSSQTLANLAAIDRATDLLVLRPLVGADKDEICALARRIGTFDLSAGIPEACDLRAGGPALKARLADLERAERGLDPELLDRALEEALSIPIEGVTSGRVEDLEIDAPPPGAGLLDLRRRPPGSSAEPAAGDLVPRSYPRVLRELPALDRRRVWVAFCELGWKSAHVAEVLRAAGYRAFALRGGARTLRRLRAGADEELLRAIESPAVLTRD